MNASTVAARVVDGESDPASSSRCRIVLTGGPGGGKTTAADLFRRELGDRVVIVPESATLLFGGGFPRSSSPPARRAAQSAIFHVQRNLEDVQSALYPGRVLLCDRGTVDGAAYWGGEPGEFFEAVGTTYEAELARYDAVVFFETAAVGGIGIEGGNPTRIEGLGEAAELDRRLRALWARHPRFWLIPHNASFFKKITFGLALMEGIVGQLAPTAGTPPSRPPGAHPAVRAAQPAPVGAENHAPSLHLVHPGDER